MFIIQLSQHSLADMEKGARFDAFNEEIIDYCSQSATKLSHEFDEMRSKIEKFALRIGFLVV